MSAPTTSNTTDRRSGEKTLNLFGTPGRLPDANTDWHQNLANDQRPRGIRHTEQEIEMNKTLATAFALALTFIPVAESVSAQQQHCTPGRNCVGTSGNRDYDVPKVCFFAEQDFKGDYFCESGMRSVSSVPKEWRHAIKSVTIEGHTAARLCNADILQGDCNIFSRDIRKLEPDLFNHVYSYDIRRTHH